MAGGDTGFSQEYRPKRFSYIPQSDIESEREDPPTLNLEGISKEQLLSVIDLLKARSYKYKNKYSEVVKNFKELRDEKIKIEKTLIETQDKGSRRIAELREQCQLEQKAKAHLEANLRLMLEEKDSRISVLETQINLLKDTSKGENAANLVFFEKSTLEPSNGDLLTGDTESSSSSDSVSQEKVERLEHQLNQAKKTITAQTEQIIFLRKQNENISKELEIKVNRVNDLEDQHVTLKSEHESVLKSMQIRLEELEKQQEESAMSMAETKKNMHEELEFKEKQLVKAEKEASQYQSTVELEKQRIVELQKRHEEKINELQRQLETTEKTLEEEKQNLMQELARGKTAAITLMQKDCAQKISAVEEEWKAKLQEIQSQKSQSDDINAIELEEKLKQYEIQVKELNSLVLHLERENESLKNSTGNLKSDIESRTVENEKLQVSYTDLEYLRKQEILNFEEKIKELNTKLKDLNCEIISYNEIKKQYHESSLILKEQLDEKTNTIDNLLSHENEFKIKIDQLEKEIINLNTVLEKNKLYVNDIQQKEYLQDKEINQLRNSISTMQTTEKSLNEKLNMQSKNIEELKDENHNLIFDLSLSKDKLSQLQIQLQKHEAHKCHMEDLLLQANLEVQNINNLLDKKEAYCVLLENNFLLVEDSLVSLEKEQTKLRKVIKFYETSFNSLYNQINCEIEQSQTLNEECTIEGYDCPEDIVIIKELEQKFGESNVNKTSMYKTHPENIHENIHLVKIEEKDNLLHKDVKNDELQNIIEDLVKENAMLRRDLHEAKELADVQNLEYAKNITELHKSLSDLHDERNNLSLVLQSIEAQSKEIKPDSSLNLNYQIKNMISKECRESDNNLSSLKVNFMDLNCKVRSEIEALSSQTEMINQELNLLRQHFNASQTMCSEKIVYLNSKLLSRTEMLIRIKEELDCAVENAETLKALLEDAQKQLEEKNEVLALSQKEKKDLENKLKSLKDKHIKKELDIKQAHNAQLSELKNQTKTSIDKLNAEIQKANSALQKKDEEICTKLSLVEDQCNKKLSKLMENFNEISILQCNSDKLFTYQTEFERKLTEKCSLLDLYMSKIDSINHEVNVMKTKLKEKDLQIHDQLRHIKELNEKLISNEENEMKLKILHEKEITTWTEKYENIVEETKKVSSLTSEKQLFDSLLSEKQSMLEKVYKQNTELNSKLNNLSALLHEKTIDHENLLERFEASEKQVLSLSSVVSENRNQLSLFESKYLTDLNLMHETSNNLSSAFLYNYELFQKFLTSLNVTDDKLRFLEIQLSNYQEKLKCSKNSLSQCKSQLCYAYQKIEKCLYLLSQVNIIDTVEKSGVNDSDKCNINTNLSSEDLENAFQKLEIEILSKLKEFLNTTNQLNALKSEIHEWEEKYLSSQESIKSFQLTEQKLLRDLEEQKYQLSCMISLEEMERSKQDLHKDMKKQNENYNNEIKELKNIIENLQREISSNLGLIEDKNCTVKELENKLSLQHNELLKDFKEEYRVKLEQLKVEKEKLNSIISEFENKVLTCQDIIKEKDIYTTDLEVKLKNLERFSNAVEEEKNSLLTSLKEKNKEIQDLTAKIDITSSHVPLETFNDCKQSYESIKQLNDRYSSDIKNLMDSIQELESKVSKQDMVLGEKDREVKILESKTSSMISLEEFETYKLKTDSHAKELCENFNNEISELRGTLENLNFEGSQMKSSLITKDNLLQDYGKLNDELDSKLKDMEGKSKELDFIVTDLRDQITKLQNEVIVKDEEIQKFLVDQMNEKSNHEESFKCLKEKYENAEKNYSTQMEELKVKISKLEKQNQLLEEKNVSLSKIKENLSEKELTLKSERDNLDTEYLEKFLKMQEDINDKNNVIIKLETDLQSLAKETSEKIEASKKKIKSLEQEREQLMHEAQERVSATEAKCREDLKSLQEERNKLKIEHKEIDQLKSKVVSLEQQLGENIKILESCKVESKEKFSQLKEQFSEYEEKLQKAEEEKQASVNELIAQLKKFEVENSKLVDSAKSFENLKSEKEALNEKLKQTELQVSSYKKLEIERDNLKLENTSLVEQLQSLNASEIDNHNILSQKMSLEKTVEDLKVANQHLTGENEKLKQEIQTLKDSFDNEVSALKTRNDYLSQQIDLLEKLDNSNKNSSSVKTYIASVRAECEKALKDKEDDVATKLKVLVRDFAEQMDIKDRDCDKIMSEVLEKNQNLEERLMREHLTEIAELRQHLFEKECALDDIRDDYEEKLQEKDEKIKEYETAIKNLSHSGSGLSQDSALLATEGSDWDDTWAVPEETLDNTTSHDHVNQKCEEHMLQIESLKEELTKCNSEIKELKVLLRLSPPESMANNNSRRESLQSIPEPTEFEYLKNIIYEYMMGKEPITLAKVIAAVLKFSETQTQQVIRKEESRHHMK